MARQSDTSDRILDAFCELIIEGGERLATLDAVARAASVSKGGLLYHFGSKDALIAGLLDRLNGLAQVDVAEMLKTEDGPLAFFIRSSIDVGSAFDLAYIAVLYLAQGGRPDAAGAIASTQRAWRDALLTEVKDTDAAEAIVLLGDGLYLACATVGTGLGPKNEDPSAFAERMLKVARRLIP